MSSAARDQLRRLGSPDKAQNQASRWRCVSVTGALLNVTNEVFEL